MTDDDIRIAVLAVLRQVAPDADASTLDPEVPFQDQLDIDSVDFMNLMVGIEQKLGVDVPERDYPKVATLAGCVAYLTGHLAAAHA